MAFIHVLTHWFAHILHLYWRAPFKVYSSSWLMEYSHLMDFTHCLFSSNKQISNTWQVGQCHYKSLSGKISSLSTWRLMHEWHWWQIVWGDLTCHQWSKSCIQSSFVKTRGGASRVVEGTQSHFLGPSKPMSDGGCRVTLHLECSWCQVCWCNEIRHRLLFLSSEHDLIFTQTSRLDRQSLGRKDLELSCGVVPSQGRNSQ